MAKRKEIENIQEEESGSQGSSSEESSSDDVLKQSPTLPGCLS